MSLEQVFEKLEKGEITFVETNKMFFTELSRKELSSIIKNKSIFLVERQKSNNPDVRKISRKLALRIPIEELKKKEVFKYLIMHKESYDEDIQNISNKLALKVIKTWKSEKLGKKLTIFYIIGSQKSKDPNVRKLSRKLAFEIPIKELVKKDVLSYLIQCRHLNKNIENLCQELVLTIIKTYGVKNFIETWVFKYLIMCKKSKHLTIQNLSQKLALNAMESWSTEKLSRYWVLDYIVSCGTADDLYIGNLSLKLIRKINISEQERKKQALEIKKLLLS